MAPRREFRVPGIGIVRPRKGQSDASAEREARRNHGRRSLRLAVMVPGIGKVSPTKGQSFRDAERAARARHGKLSSAGRVRTIRQTVTTFSGPPTPITDLMDEPGLTQLTVDTVRGLTASQAVAVRITGEILLSPEFLTPGVPFDETVPIDDPPSFDVGSLFGVIRDLLERKSPNEPLVFRIIVSWR